MKKLLTILFLSISALSFGQAKIVIKSPGGGGSTDISNLQTKVKAISDSIALVGQIKPAAVKSKVYFDDGLTSTTSTAAIRVNNVLYNLLDDSTGEQLSFKKVTTWEYGITMSNAKVDGVIYRKKGSEYFKRIFSGSIYASWWGYKSGGGKADSTANTVALQAAIDYVYSLRDTTLLEVKSTDVILPAGDSYCSTINFKGYTMIRGAGRATTMVYYVGNEYWLNGITGNIRNGGMSDLSVTSSGAVNKGFIKLMNAYNMVFQDFSLFGEVYGSQVTEAVIKMESKFDWPMGVNNNLFNITFDRFNIEGSGGYGVLLTGDYGSVQTTLSNGVIERCANNLFCATSPTASVAHTNIVLDNLILQGGTGTPIKLEWVTGFYFRGYTETINDLPAIIFGGAGKPVFNCLIENSHFGTGTSFGGSVFKSGAPVGDGTIFATNNLVFLNTRITTGNPNDIVFNINASGVKVIGLGVSGTTKLFKAYDNFYGTWSFDLFNHFLDSALLFTEATTGNIVPVGMTSVWKGNVMISTNIERLKTISTVKGNINQNDIGSTVVLNGVDTLHFGQRNNYLTTAYKCYNLVNNSSTSVVRCEVSNATINGAAFFNIPAKTKAEVIYEGNGNFLITLPPVGGILSAPNITGKYLNGFNNFSALNTDSIAVGTKKFSQFTDINSTTMQYGTTGSKLGVGRTPNYYNLEAEGDIYATGSILAGSSTGVGLSAIGNIGYVAGHAGLAFSTNQNNVGFVSGEKMRLTTAGDLGIGVSAPTAKLHVVGTGIFSGQLTVPNATASTSAVNKSQLDSIKAPPVIALTDAATITWDVSITTNRVVTLLGNRTLSISNAVAGQYGTVVVKQDATGSRTLSLPSGSKVAGGTGAVTLTATANASDILTFYFDGTTYFWNASLNYN